MKIKYVAVWICFLGLLFFKAVAYTTPAENIIEKDPQQIEKEEDAEKNRVVLEQRIERDGFYSARSALNVWKTLAQSAGIFDLEQYNKYKKRIYGLSIQKNLYWFNKFVEHRNLRDAQICLDLWRLQSMEIGNFSQEEYENLYKKLQPTDPEQE